MGLGGLRGEGRGGVPLAQGYPDTSTPLHFLPGRETISWPALFLPIRFQKAGAPVTPFSPPSSALPLPRELGLK